MKNGKLPSPLLEKLISDIKISEDVIAGPQIGLDAAKIKTFGKNLIIGADPISFVCDNIGKYSVYINSNDICVSGGIPKFFISTILLPTNTEESAAECIFNNVKEACNKLNISLIGGHTEITDSVTRPIVSGTMLGEEIISMNPQNTPINSDIILINKPAIEGTAIIANSGEPQLIKSGVSKNTIDYAKNLSEKICLFPYMKEIYNILNNISNNKPIIHYMHDPTEGGIASALWELSMAIKKEIRIEHIDFMDETLKFCKIFGLNPLGLIASGSLLIVAENGDILTKKFKKQNIYAEIIGKTYKGLPKLIYKDKEMKPFDRDEITFFFEKL